MLGAFLVVLAEFVLAARAPASCGRRPQNDRFPDARYNRRGMPEQATLPPTETDSSRIFDLLLQLGLGPRDAYAFDREVERMAGQNIIARMDAQAAELKAEIRNIYRNIGYAGVIFGLILTALMLVYRIASG